VSAVHVVRLGRWRRFKWKVVHIDGGFDVTYVTTLALCQYRCDAELVAEAWRKRNRKPR
jgi:hypothetical protein